MNGLEAGWIIVGAGFAGLAAVRRLAEHHPDQRIVVLEAHCADTGESTQGGKLWLSMYRHGHFKNSRNHSQKTKSSNPNFEFELVFW